MSAPERLGPTFDTLIVEPVPPLEGTGARTGARTGSADHGQGSTGRSEDRCGRSERTAGELTPDGDEPVVPPAAPGTVVVPVRKRFTELDGLRGVAALLVVFFHLRRNVRDLDPPDTLYQLVNGGYLMVDLFFVLSGFVLARTMLSTRTVGDALWFSSLRARRFLPLHLTGVAIAFGCVSTIWLAQHYGIEHAPARPAFSNSQESPFGYLSAVLLLQGLIGPQFAGYDAAWSLSIELWTNILLVAAIALVPWPNRKQWVGPAAVVIGAVVLATADSGAENSVGMTAFGRGLTGLGVGMVVYLLYTAGVRRGVSTVGSHREPGRTRGVPWPAVGAALGLITLLAAMRWSTDLRPLNFLPIFPIAGVLLFCLAQPSAGPAHALMNSRIAQWLGSRSFALYALHAPVLMAVQLCCRLVGYNMRDPKVAVVIIVTTVVSSLCAAEIGHRYIERAWTPGSS
jgi:peptidoglycan/LPS O-acetylase OafA/YrhL